MKLFYSLPRGSRCKRLERLKRRNEKLDLTDTGWRSVPAR